MIILQDINDLLEIKLNGAVTTNQLPVFASWVDTTSTSYTPGQTNGVTNDTTVVTVVGSPAAATQRTIKFISVYNADTVAATVIIQINDNTTTRILLKALIDVSGRVEYTDTVGFRTFAADGSIKTTASSNTTITLSGDATGSGISSIPVTFATVNGNIGTFGSATQVGQFIVNAKGLLTAAANVTITPAFSSLTGTPTTLGGYGISLVDGGTF